MSSSFFPTRRGILLAGLAAAAGIALAPHGHAQQAWTFDGVSRRSVGWLADTRRVIVDTDPGTDDMLAIIMMLASSRIETEAITVTPGNVEYEQEVRNALYLAHLFGQKVPVYRGTSHPLMSRTYPKAGFIHGKYGLGDMAVPDEKLKPAPGPAAMAIVDIVNRHPGEVTLLALGGLSNIALALLLDPDLARKTRGVVVVGGRYSGIGTAVSFNAMVDPEAADIVLRSGIPIVMTGDLGTSAMLTQRDFDEIRSFGTQRSKLFLQSNEGRLKFETQSRHKMGATYNDPMAAAILLDPTVIEEFEAVHIAVELAGTETRGAYVFGGTHVYTGEALTPNVDICVKASVERFRAQVFAALRK